MSWIEENLNSIILGDCLEVMKNIPDKSIDMILCDLPYGTTACKWDVIIPFDLLWEQYKRIIKDNGAIVLTASQPFTTDLINSNRSMFKYELIWDKIQGKQPFLAKIQPMKAHENILVFSKGKTTYNPQMIKGITYSDKRKGQIAQTEHYTKFERQSYDFKEDRYPTSIISINNPNFEGMHSTQKPIQLFEWLISTYTNKSEIVLDNCSGSGTTAIACHNLNRNFICIEKDADYYKASVERLKNAQAQMKLFVS